MFVIKVNLLTIAWSQRLELWDELRVVKFEEDLRKGNGIMLREAGVGSGVTRYTL